MASVESRVGVRVAATRKRRCSCCTVQDPKEEELQGREANRAKRTRQDMGGSRRHRPMGNDATPRAITDDGTKSSPPAVLEPTDGYSEAAESHLLLEVLHSFVIFIHPLGRILFVSDNVDDHLGIPQVSIIGRPASDFIHPEDTKELTKQMKVERTKSTPVSGEGRGTQTRLFYMRMKFYLQRKGARTRQSGYRLVQFSGGLQLQNAASPGASTVRGLLCLCRPMQIPSVLEIRMDGNMFMSRHDLGMTFTFCDPRIVTLIGYEPKELIGKTAYYFHNPLDATKVSNCHSNLIIKGSSVSKYYRFMGKQGMWVWLQTRASIIYNTKNKPQYIVCMNYVIGEEEGQRYLMMEQEQLGYRDPNIQGCLELAPSSHRSDDVGYVSASSSAASSPESDATSGGTGGSGNLDHLDSCSAARRRHHHSSMQTAYGVQLSQQGDISNSNVQYHIKTPGARLAEAGQGMGHMTSEDSRATEAPMDISESDSIFVCSMSAHMTFGDSSTAKRPGGNQSSLMLPRAGNNFCMDTLNSEVLDNLRPEDAHSPMDTMSHGDEDMFSMGLVPKDSYHAVHLSSGDDLSRSSADLQNDVDSVMLCRSGKMQSGSAVKTTTMNNPMMSMTSLGNTIGSCGSQVSGGNLDIFASSGVTDNDVDPFFFSTEQLGTDLEATMANNDDSLDLITLLETMADSSSPNMKITLLEESACTAAGSLSTAPASSLASVASSGSANFTTMPSNSVDHQNRSSQYGGLESLVNFCQNTPPEKIAVSPGLVCGTSASQGSMPVSRPLCTSTGNIAAPTFTASKSQEQQRRQESTSATVQSDQGSLLGQMLIANSSASQTEAVATTTLSTFPSASNSGGDQNSSLCAHLPRPRSSSQQSLLRTLLDKEELTEEELALIPMGSCSGNTSPSTSGRNPFEADMAALRQPRRKSSTSESSPWSQLKTPNSGQDMTPRLGSLLSLHMGVPSPSDCSLLSPGTPSNSNLPEEIMEFAMEFCDKFNNDQSTSIMTDIDEQMLVGQDHSYLQTLQTFSRPKTHNGKVSSKASTPNMVSASVGTSTNPREAQGSALSPYDVQRSCYHDHAYFAAQEPRRNNGSTPWRSSSNGKVSQASQGFLHVGSPRSISSSTTSHRGSNGKVAGKLPGSNSSSKLQAMLTLTQSLGQVTPGSSSSLCGLSSQQPSSSSSLPPSSPLSDNGSCSSGSSSMSELEKHLRGFVPQSPSSFMKNLSNARNGSVPYLQKLLTGELSQELYREIDHQLITEERQKRTALHKSLPDMRV